MATAQDMANDLRAMVGNPTPTSMPDVTLFALISKAVRKISDDYRFKATRKRQIFNTVVGTNQYALPVDCYAVRQLWDQTNGKKLTKRGTNWLARNAQALSSGPVTPGRPTDYVSYSGYVQLVPPPDGIYQLEVYYIITIPDLVNATDIPLLPPDWHDGATMLARWYFYDRIKPDLQKSAYALNMWKDWVRTHPTDIELETYDIDSGVEVPTLQHHIRPKLDFDHSD